MFGRSPARVPFCQKIDEVCCRVKQWEMDGISLGETEKSGRIRFPEIHSAKQPSASLGLANTRDPDLFVCHVL